MQVPEFHKELNWKYWLVTLKRIYESFWDVHLIWINGETPNLQYTNPRINEISPLGLWEHADNIAADG